MASSKEQAIKNLEKARTPEGKAKNIESRMANHALKTAVYDNLKSALSSQDKKGVAYYSSFIQKFLFPLQSTSLMSRLTS